MKHLRSTVAVGAAVVLFGSLAAHGQSGSRYRARLSIVPVDFAASLATSGSGSVTAVLVGNELFITGTFAGMSSVASAAHLHRAPKGLRGPVAFPLSVAKSASGVLGGGFKLTDAQVQEVRDGLYYVQVHTETNPAGEIRGWLLPEDSSP